MTVSVAEDSKKGKRSHAIIPLRPLEIISVIFEEKVKEIRNSNDGVFLTQPAPVGVRLSEFWEGLKHITYDPYVLSFVTKGYRFMSPLLLGEIPWEIRSPQRPEEIRGMLEQRSLMLQKNVIMEVPPNSPGF